MPQYTYEQLQALNEQAQQTTQDPPQDAEGESQPGLLSRFWTGLRDRWNSDEGLVDEERLARAAVRGPAKAFNEASDAVMGAGRELVQHTGAYKLRDKEYEERFLSVADKPIEEVNPLRFDVAERDTGVYGFVESATQFAVGMVGFGKLLKPVKALQGAGVAATVARGAAEGALTDLTVMDPYEARIADLMQDSRFANPVAEILQSKEDDSQVVARFKTAAEGLITGVAADLTIAGIRAVRASRAAKAGKISVEDAKRQIKEIMGEAEEAAAKSDDPVVVEHTPGEPSVIKVRQENLFDDDTMRALTEEGAPMRADQIEVADPAKAESLGASMNLALKNDKIPRASLTRGQREAVQDAVARLAAGENEEEVLKGIAPQLNLAHFQTPDEVHQWIKAFGAEAGEIAKKLANRRSDGNGQGWPKTISRGLSWVTGVSDDQMVNRLRTLFGDTEELPGQIWATRQWVAAKTLQVVDLSKKVETAADPRILQARLDRALDSLWEGHNSLAGLLANTGRALDAAKIPVDGELPLPRIHEDSAESAAKAAGGAKGSAGADVGSGPKGARPGETVEDLTRSGESHLRSNAKHVRRIVDPKEPLSKNLTPTERRTLARALTFSNGDPTKVLDALRITKFVKENVEDATVWQKALSWRANMMLSGPKTQLVNFIGNLSASLQVPAEYWWAGKRSGDEALAQQGADILRLNALNLLDSAQSTMKALLTRDADKLNPTMQAVRQAWSKGDNVLDPMQMQLEHQAYANPGGQGWLSKIVSAPSRALMSGDEFFKQMNYRSHVASQSLRLSREQGVTDATRMAERLADDLHMAFDVEGGAVNVNALEHARYTTFSNKLDSGTIGGDFQKFLNQHPSMRIIFPFFRTPVNIFRFAWHRTPALNRLSRQVREEIAAGGERAAIAKARIEAGYAMYSMGALFAATNTMTGGGPKDPSLRRQWLDAGNQPYALKIGGKQFSYRRLEPLATPLALIADAVQVAGEADQKDFETVVSSIVAGAMSSVSSKTFLLGMSQFFDAMASGEEWQVKRLMSDIGLSFVVPNAARQLNPDPVWRESRNILEEFQSRVPWMSEGLEPRRNLFGEKVMKAPGYLNQSMNPFTTMDVPEDSSVASQLVALGRSMTMPRTTWEGGRIDLTSRSEFDNGSGQSPYDRMLELMQDTPKGVPSLRESLLNLMQTDAWKNANDGTEVHPGGLRFEMADKVVRRYQENAKKIVLKEYPELLKAVQGERILKRNSLFDALAESPR